LRAAGFRVVEGSVAVYAHGTGLPDFHSYAVFNPSHAIRLPFNQHAPNGPYLAPDLKQAY